MKKLIASLMILGSIGSSYAYYASPGTVVHGPYIESSNKGKLNVEFTLKENSPVVKKTLSVNATAIAYNATGSQGYAISVKGGHNVAIYNHQKTYQRYHYTFQLSAADAYVNYGYDIDVPPNGGQFSTSGTTEGTVKNAHRGTYTIKAATFITGSESVGHDSTATLLITK